MRTCGPGGSVGGVSGLSGRANGRASLTGGRTGDRSPGAGVQVGPRAGFSGGRPAVLAGGGGGGAASGNLAVASVHPPAEDAAAGSYPFEERVGVHGAGGQVAPRVRRVVPPEVQVRREETACHLRPLTRIAGVAEQLPGPDLRPEWQGALPLQVRVVEEVPLPDRPPGG